MLKLKHIGAALVASVIATAIVVDTADARRGGGGGMRAGGGFGGGGAMRAGGFNRGGALAGGRIGNAGSLARVSNPARAADIGRPGRPGRPDVGLPGRPGDRPGWGWGGGGWGWGAAALGAGLAYGAAASNYYCDPNYDPYCTGGYPSYGYAPAYGTSYGPAAYGASDAVAECARRFRSYDPASQTYLSYSGQRVPCP
jgi:hypothetical protein